MDPLSFYFRDGTKHLGSSTSRKPEKKTFGRFCVVFSCVAAGRVRQKAIIVFFSPTFATTPPLTQLLQETSIAQSSRKSSADASFLSRIGAKAKLLSGSRESKVRECRISSFSKISRKPRQENVNRSTRLFSKSRRTSHGEKYRRAIYVACAFTS